MRTLLAAALVGLRSLIGADSATLTPTGGISLPNVDGRFDHFAIDTQTHRLFVAALGNNTLEILDVKKVRRIQAIAGLRKPTGVLFLTGSGQIVVGCGDDGTCRFYDGKSYGLIATISKLDDADNLRFDPRTNLVYLGYGDGALGIINPKKHELVGSVSLQGHPESFQLESQGPRIFVNVPDQKHIAVVDRERKAVVAIWPLEGASHNFPMALDEKNQRVFVGCRRPARLLIYDTVTGKKVSDAELSGDTDDLFFDSKAGRIYASCGEGFVDVFSVNADGVWKRDARMPTAPGARTSFFSAELHEFYLAVPKRPGQEANVQIFRAGSVNP